MPGLEEIKWFSTLGVGGALALFVYMMYRKDFLRERKNHNTCEDRLFEAYGKNTQCFQELSGHIQELSSTIKLASSERAREIQTLVEALRLRF